MKKIIFLLALFLNLQAMEMELKPAEIHDQFKHKLSLELDVFGASYHTNRSYGFNEFNPGAGLSLVLQSDTEDPGYHFSLVASAGTYQDSYSEQAYYVAVGPRFTLGYQNSFHVSTSIQVGWLDGSGGNGQSYLPFFTVGYDWIDLGFTGDPLGSGGKTKDDYTRFVAVFLKFKLLDF